MRIKEGKQENLLRKSLKPINLLEFNKKVQILHNFFGKIFFE
jgi:hypothetical protein